MFTGAAAAARLTKAERGMFELFTGPARRVMVLAQERVMVLAQEEARMLRHGCTAAGNILPGPICAGTGLAAPGAGVAAEPGGARFCPAGPARGSHVFGR